jgi:hypothetical protein
MLHPPLFTPPYARLAALVRACSQATFGSEDPFTKRGSPPKKMKGLHVRFFICLGDRDDDAIYDSQTTKSALELSGAPMVVTHKVVGLDHHMPKQGDPAYSKMITLFKDAVAGKEIPEEHKPLQVVDEDRGLFWSKVWHPQNTKFDKKTGLNSDGDSPLEIILERKRVFRTNTRGGPVDEEGNYIPGFHQEKTDMDYRMMEQCERLGRQPDFLTWTIPPEAPPGWGMGKGDEYLRANPEFIPDTSGRGLPPRTKPFRPGERGYRPPVMDTTVPGGHAPGGVPTK